MKTTLEWYNDILDPEIRTRAINNRKRSIKIEGKDRIVPSLSVAIALGFYAELSPEGTLFWNTIYNDIISGNLKTYNDYKDLTIDVIFDKLQHQNSMVIEADRNTIVSFGRSFFGHTKWQLQIDADHDKEKKIIRWKIRLFSIWKRGLDSKFC